MMIEDAVKPIAEAASCEALAKELIPEMKLRSYKDLDVYVTTATESPTVMAEIGRIREREYRAVGAGRGVDRDIDGYDTGFPCYKQLVAWDPEAGEIVAMYRFLFAEEALRAGDLSRLRTTDLFRFSETFRRDYLPNSVELGRSVVNREAKRAILGLFVVWAGLGAFVAEYPEIEYFFGNVSVYRTWPTAAVDTLLAFLYEHYRGETELISALEETAYRSPGIEALRARLFAGTSRAGALETLSAELKQHGLTPPPILLSYMKATESLAVFDTARDADFGGALETALWVPVAGLGEKTKRRFLESYVGENPGALTRYGFAPPGRTPGGPTAGRSAERRRAARPVAPGYGESHD
ncbi:MAG: GNAT family N-acetyltransferase [Spirochaetota bacterium]